MKKDDDRQICDSDAEAPIPLEAESAASLGVPEARFREAALSMSRWFGNTSEHEIVLSPVRDADELDDSGRPIEDFEDNAEALEDGDELPTEDVEAGSFLAFYDDDDDIGDFDELDDLDGKSLSEIETPNFLPSPAVFDMLRDDRSEEDAPQEVGGNDDVESDGSLVDDVGDDLEPDGLMEDDGSFEASEPSVEDAPSVKELPDPPLIERESPPPLELGFDEQPKVQREASLALQPIPELQTASRPKGNAAAKSASLELKADTPSEDACPVIDDGPLLDEGDDGAVDEDAGLDLTEALSSAPDFDDAIDIDSPEPDAAMLELSPSMRTIDDDWHAHLASMMSGNDEEPDPASSDELTLEPADLQPAAADEENDEDQPPTLLLSHKLTADLLERSDIDMSDPVPSMQHDRARKAETPPKNAAADLPPEQLATAIIANVPRLRRFAAALIGDEALADRLVQTNVETVLSTPTALDASNDLGLALLALVYRQRQVMLVARPAEERLAEAAHTFESTLCKELAGADQFEIHGFACAINALDEHDRALLLLVALENLSYQDMACIVGIPRTEIMTRMAHSRLSLRQTLSDYDPSAVDGSSILGNLHEREPEIHGYLDGELDDPQMADIDVLIEQDDDAADRLLQYGIQGDLIRRLYAPLLNRPIPHTMLAAISTAAKPVRRSFLFGPRKALMTGAILFMLAAAGWTYIAPTIGTIVPEALAVSSGLGFR